MRLLAATIGEEAELSASNESAKKVAGAVAGSPDAFLRAYQQLDQAGWEPVQHLPGSLREIARAYGDRLAQAGFHRIPEVDWELKSAVRSATPVYSQMLVVGFDGAHWPLFPLLSAAAHAAEETAVLLTEPREEARAVDALWTGTWEQEFAATTPVSGEDRKRPLADVLTLPELKADIERRSAEPAECIDFLVTENAGDLAKVICQRVLQALATSESPRVAVVFPKASALSRLVSKRLGDARVPHNDALGHPLADAIDDPAWTAWLRMQDDRRAAPFSAFLQECRTVPQLSALGAEEVSRRLSKELGELLIDDLTVLAASLEAHSQQSIAQSIAAGLRDLVWLPERAEIGDMYASTLRAFAQLGWQTKAIDLRKIVAGWIGRIPGTISRRFWLGWMQETLFFVERQRELAGRHPYARVHLISLAEAAPLEWSHVILAGLNESDWPLVSDDDGWLSDSELAGLNARARSLNATSVQQGRHGEGHEALRPDHTWCLTSGDLRGILQRQFFNLMENASEGVAATALMRSAEEPERISPPAEFFGRLYFCARGRAVSPAIMEALRDETSRWFNRDAEIPATKADEVKETRKAWDARRKEDRPFGEFEFALRAAPSKPVSLAATDWESLLQTPALVFLEHFLGVTAPEEADPDFTPRAIGTWVHRWLAKIGAGSRDGFVPLPPAVECEKIVRKAAEVDRCRVEALMSGCGRVLPDWWRANWEQALSISTALARLLPADSGWTHCSTEFRLGEMSVAVGQGLALRLSGRIDLLLAHSANNDSRVPAGLVWIVDYKTGDPKELKVAKLAQGDGLQLALYGLAARSLGASDVQMSRLGCSLDLGEAQLTGEELEGLQPLWHGLVDIQETGRFGLLGAIRSEYGTSATYPLATLGVDVDLLKDKWELTHPKLNGSDE
jgi:hypothetical protein